MKRRVLLTGVLLVVLAIIALRAQESNAQIAGRSTRTKTVEIRVTQYIWELVSNQDGRVICQVIVEHPNRPSNADAIQICGAQIFPPEPTSTPFATPAGTLAVTPGVTPTPGPTSAPTAQPAASEPFDLAEFFRGVTWRFVASRTLEREVQVSVPEIIVNLTIPPGQSGPPFFVTISAYEPVYGERITAIYGVLNNRAFTCAGPRCDVPITTDSILEFWATSSVGDESRRSQAALRIARVENRVFLELVSLQPIVLFRDSCAEIWGLPLAGLPEWAALPAGPDELNTSRPYQYLAGQLIAAGIVDARDCPGGGLGASGAPNACGLERAGPTVIEWQNQFDVAIWEAGRNYGIPPVLIKTMFGQESQFWPNARRWLFEYGLGQLSQAGVDVLLRWDNEQFATTCSGLLFDCSLSYARLPTWLQATLRGGLVRSLDTQCPTCPNGIDLQRAYESVPIYTRTLRANCYQTKYLLDRNRAEATYEDLWKFTFVSYHSGYACLDDALAYTRFNRQPYDWPHVSAYLSGSCLSGLAYVNNLWTALEEFDAYRLRPPASTEPQVLPEFAALPEPTRTPTPIVAMSRIRVLVYQDANNNAFPDAGERIDGINVVATFAGGETLSARTAGGEVVFDLSGRQVGADVQVSLPELFRSQRVRVTRDGEIPIIFRLEQPVLPPALP